MATVAQIRGLLLEEAVLHLLRKSGYKTVEDPEGDPTLRLGGAGLFVIGRGSAHQIDAIADFLVYQPFTNPHRLLAEAKCYSKHPVRLPEIRNAVGVLKDVSEYWIPGDPPAGPAKKRFHYQYALFSASGFTEDAQHYAFAHDIYLIPLGQSQFFQQILDAIRFSTKNGLAIQNLDLPVGALRRLRLRVRYALRQEALASQRGDEDPLGKLLFLDPFIVACKEIDYVLLGVLGGTFPILLTPSQHLRHGDIPQHIHVRIFRDGTGWHLKDPTGVPLFSFDLPAELFNLYANEGVLTQEAAIAMKQQFMSVFQAIKADGNEIRIINFTLDWDWLAQIQERLRRNG